jgi:hypothetical protein
VLGQLPLPAHQGVGGAGDRLPQLRLGHQAIELADQIVGVAEEQRRAAAGEMAIGIEVLQHRHQRAAGVLQELHIGAAAVELGGQQRRQADVEPFQPIEVLRQRAGHQEAKPVGVECGERFGQHRIAHQLEAHMLLPLQPGDQGRSDRAQILPMSERAPPTDHQGALRTRGSRSRKGAQRRQLLQLVGQHRDPPGPIRQPLAEGLGGHLGAVAAADQLIEAEQRPPIAPGGMGRVPGLHIGEVVVHLTEAGPPQLAALVDQPEHLHIQRHGEHHHIGGQHGGVVVAGLGMHLEHLHPLQLRQGGSGLMQAIEVIADRAHAAHQHQAQWRVAAATACRTGVVQPLGRVRCGRGWCGRMTVRMTDAGVRC